MKEEIIEGWVKIFETPDLMTCEITEARLRDEGIQCQLLNKSDIGYTMDMGNSQMARSSVGLPYKFFVKPEDAEKALAIVNEDKSQMMDDPDMEFESSEE